MQTTRACDPGRGDQAAQHLSSGQSRVIDVMRRDVMRRDVTRRDVTR